MALRRELLAGLANSAFASLTTFVVGVYAARTFSAEVLGIFALFSSAFLFSAMVPNQAIWLPLEAWSVSLKLEDRCKVVGGSIRAALPFLLLAPVAPILFAYASSDPSGLYRDETRALAWTACAAATISPLQDHLRRMFFLCRRPWDAAISSFILFCTAVVALAAFPHLGVDETVQPLGALVAANIISTSYALVRFRTWRRAVVEVEIPPRRELFRSGSWLLLSNCLLAGTTLVGFMLVGRLAGLAQLGYLEAARTVSQPVVVFAVGFSSALAPRTMEAVANRNTDSQEKLIRLGSRLCLAFGLLYALVAGWDHPLNPMSNLVPKAYVVPGLVVLLVAGSSLRGAIRPLVAALLAKGRTRPMAGVDLVASLLLVLTCSLAGRIGAFSYATGFLLLGIIRQRQYQRLAFKESN